LLIKQPNAPVGLAPEEEDAVTNPSYDGVFGPDNQYMSGYHWIPSPGVSRVVDHCRFKIETMPGTWSPTGRVGEWHRIYGAASELLLDTRDIPHTEVKPSVHGLLVQMRLDRREACFRLDAENGSFRNLGTGDAPRPLSDLAAAVAQHLKLVNDGEDVSPPNNWEHLERVFSPDATYRLDLRIGEDGWGRPTSHVSVALTENNATVFDPREWSYARHEFCSPTHLELQFWRINMTLFVSVFPHSGVGRFAGLEEDHLPLAQLPARMRAEYYRPGAQTLARQTVIVRPDATTAQPSEGGEAVPQTEFHRLPGAGPWPKSETVPASDLAAAPEAMPAPAPVQEPAAALPSHAARATRRIDWVVLLVGLVPLLAGIGMVYSAAGSLTRASTGAGAAASWPAVTGHITRTWLETGSTAGNRGLSHAIYTPRVAYDYQVGGKRYQSERLSLAQQHQEMARGAAEAALARYPVGGAVEVRYEPTNPAQATLVVEGPGSILYLMLGLGLLLGLFGIYCLWRVLQHRFFSPGS
jgi:hypothetical protein